MALSASELWETYVRYYNFTQLGWLFDSFTGVAENDFVAGDGQVAQVIESWLEHNWPDVLLTTKVNGDNLRLAIDGQTFPLNFNSFIHVLTQYEAIHIANEKFAGFPREDIDQLEDIYNSHNSSVGGGGLRGNALFAVLDDLGIEFHSKEEREWYVEVVRKLDRNQDGSIDFPELCQIIRTVVNMESEKNRMREFNLVKQSGLPFDEVEDWNVLFTSTEAKAGGEELEMAQVKELFSSIGVKWDAEFSHTIKAWIEEADENNNGKIDFGEFCLVVGKLWAANLHDIRGCARSCGAKDTVVALLSVHGTYLAANAEGQIVAQSAAVADNETFTMISIAPSTVSFRSYHGTFIICSGEKVECREENAGTQFKVTTLEDERVILKASTSFGGTLFAKENGEVALSDGNPDDVPFFPFTIVKKDELTKRAWSKVIPRRSRRPSTLKMSGRKEGAVEPISPDLQLSVDAIDKALDENRNNSAR